MVACNELGFNCKYILVFITVASIVHNFSPTCHMHNSLVTYLVSDPSDANYWGEYFGNGGSPRHSKYYVCAGTEQRLSECDSYNDTSLRSYSDDIGIECSLGIKPTIWYSDTDHKIQLTVSMVR